MRLTDFLVFGALGAPILGLPTTDSLSKRMVKDPYKDCIEYPLNPSCPQIGTRAVVTSIQVSTLDCRLLSPRSATVYNNMTGNLRGCEG